MRVQRGGGRCGRGEHPARRCEGRAWRRRAWLDHRKGSGCRAERDRPRPLGAGGGLRRGGGERSGPGDPDKPRRRPATSEYPVLGACQQVEHLSLSALGLSLKNLCPTPLLDTVLLVRLPQRKVRLRYQVTSPPYFADRLKC